VPGDAAGQVVGTGARSAGGGGELVRPGGDLLRPGVQTVHVRGALREGVVCLGQRLRGAARLVRELIGEIGGALALLRIGCRGLGVLLQRDQVLLDGVGAVGEGGGGLGEGGGPLGDAGGGALQLLEIGDERIGGAGHPLRGVADVGRAVGRGGGGLIGGGRVGR